MPPLPALVEPVQARFPPHQAGLSKHKLGNPNPWPMAVKIRCSDNRLYRVHPVFALIRPGEWRQLTVAHSPGPAKLDKLVVQSLWAPEGAAPGTLDGLFRQAGARPLAVTVALVGAEDSADVSSSPAPSSQH